MRKYLERGNMSEERILWLVLAVILLAVLLGFGIKMFSGAAGMLGGI